MANEYPFPNIPVTSPPAVLPIPPATTPKPGTDPGDITSDFVFQDMSRILTIDRVGPSAANRQHIVADQRTRRIMDIVRALVANSNMVDPFYLRRDGQTQSGSAGMLANLAMNSYKITGMANGTSSGDAVNFGQLDLKVAKAGDTMTGNLVMANSQAIMGKETGGTARYMAYVSAGNEVILGSSTNVLRLLSLGSDVLAAGAGLGAAHPRIHYLAPLAYQTPLRGYAGSPSPGTLVDLVTPWSDGIYFGADASYGVSTILRGLGLWLSNHTYLVQGMRLYGTISPSYYHIGSINPGTPRAEFGDTNLTYRPAIFVPPGDFGLYLTDGPNWHGVWHDGNLLPFFGHGSGVNADMLDGLHAGEIGRYNYAVLTGSASWQVPSGVTRIIALIWGAGGGGGGGGGGDGPDDFGGAGGGGGAGGPCDLVEMDVTPLSWIAYSCGAAGLGGAGGLARKRGYSGTAGGSTTFNGYTVPGGAYGHGGHDGGLDAAPPPDPDPPQNAGGVSNRNSGSGGDGGDGGAEGGSPEYPGDAGSAGEAVRWDPTWNRRGLGGARVVQDGSGGGGGGGGAPACPLAIGGNPGYAGTGGQGGPGTGSGAAGGPATGTAAGGGGGGGGGDDDGLGGAGGNGGPGVIVILW